MDKRSFIAMSQIMLPNQANVAGNVHGGEIMKMMDTAAGAVAKKYARTNCVTARVEELQFHLPIFVGDLVECNASVVYTGRTSMEIYVCVTSEDLQSENGPQKALSAHFTMVSLNKEGRPHPVVAFVPETEEEQFLYQEAKQRVAIFKAKTCPATKQ